MPSRSEQILAAIETTLVGTTGLGTRIWRDRYEPPSREECPCAVIFPEVELPQAGPGLQVQDAAMRVCVDLFISGRPLSTLADPARVSIHQKLQANRTLGGLSYDIQPAGVEWDGSMGEVGIARLKYIVKFRTLRTDLTQGI